MHTHPHLPAYTDEFETAPVEELLGNGCSELTLDVMQRFTAGTWHRYAEIVAMPRRRWQRVSAPLTKHLIARVEGVPAFNIGAWAGFVSSLPGAVACRDDLALQFGVAPEQIRPARRAPRKRRDLRDWRRMQQRIGPAHWPRLLEKTARWLSTDWPAMRDAWHVRLDDGSTDDSPLQAAQRFSDVLQALIAAWEAPVVADHIAATSQAIYADVASASLTSDSSGPGLPDSLAALLTASTHDHDIGAAIDAWMETYGWESMRSLELAASPYRNRPDEIRSWVRDVHANGTRSFSPPPPTQLSADAQLVLHAIMLREAAGAARTEAFAVLRHAAHNAAQSLTTASLISDSTDMFALSVDEIMALADGTASHAPQGSDTEHHGASPPSDTTDTARPDGIVQLQGAAASSGIVDARPIVLDSPSIDAPVAGRIIVCRHTDPAWMPLLVRCAGLITERGSVLSHAAIVARELQLPAIVGVVGICAAAHHAERIHMDGSSGGVTVLPASDPPA